MSLDAASRDEIARLFGRAAFGATAADLAEWVGKPYAAAVDHLLQVPTAASRAAAPDEGRRQVVQQSGRGSKDLSAAQRWWLERLRTTKYPLEERMTLLWHGHFATSLRFPYPDVSMLMVQNDTIRRDALGNFRDLAVALTLDPAMLEWLDGSRSTYPHANENYGRELMELFTLGKFPQLYSEADVREAARVLTGWTVNTVSYDVKFQPSLHDPGSKTVLGTTIANAGADEYKSLLNVLLSQPIAPRFVAYKLVANLAYLPPPTDLVAQPDPLVAKVADALRSSDWNIAAAIRVLLLSDEFRTGDARASRKLVRSPIETVVAAAKALNVSLDNKDVINRLVAMGQAPFSPPNVGGWPLGPTWLSASTALARYSWAVLCQNQTTQALPPSSDFDGFAQLLGLGTLSDATVAALRGCLAEQPSAPEAARQASVLVLLLSAPEWTVM